MSGLFSTFNVGKRGMFAQQRSLDVTSHNISNANTPGYSRQRAELQTTRPFCTPGLNSAAGPGQLGTGVEAVAINRVRDSFLDYQVRVESGISGWYKGREKFLSEIENIMNEPTDVGISTLIGKFFDGWQEVSLHAETPSARKVLAEQSLALAGEMNHTYNQLDKLKQDTQTSIKDSVFTMNGLLEQVSSLNQEIIQVKITGNNPNDLMDRRDLLLDQLSEKFGIKVEQQNYNGINLKPAGINLNLVQCIEPDKVNRFAYISDVERDSATGNVTARYYINGDMTSEANKREIKLGNLTADEFKELEQKRVIMTDKSGKAIAADGKTPGTWSGDVLTGVKLGDLNIFTPDTGDIKGYQTVQDDVDNYKNQLNKLAKAFALAVNAVHTQKSDANDPHANDDGLNFFVNSKDPTANGEKDITAQNITVNKELLEDPMKIRACAPGSNESNGDRALAIAQLRSTIIRIQDINANTTRQSFLNGLFKHDTKLNVDTVTNSPGGMTLDNYFKDIVNRLGIQSQEAKRVVKNQQTLLASISESRDSVSGVSLDEEMANLVQSQHCYQANAKVIATVDQLLDVVVNGLKR